MEGNRSKGTTRGEDERFIIPLTFDVVPWVVETRKGSLGYKTSERFFLSERIPW